MRKDGHVGRIKKINEREKERAARKGKALSFFTKLGKLIGWLVVIFVVMSMIGPMIAINYIRSQVKQGEWGTDFKAENYINRYNYTAPEPQKEEDNDEDFDEEEDKDLTN
tara:strand:- start:121 stop:450 length:330 start_codon:yes stop_codon:yes gene_type:complete